MLACKHFQLYGMKTYVKQSDGYSWNAWIHVYDENNNLYYSSFRAGLFWEFVKHLAESPECREEVGVETNEVKEILNKIEDEWRKNNEN